MLTCLMGRWQVLAFAKTRSDALVKRKTPNEMDTHKADRLERKSASQKRDDTRMPLARPAGG